MKQIHEADIDRILTAILDFVEEAEKHQKQEHTTWSHYCVHKVKLLT